MTAHANVGLGGHHNGFDFGSNNPNPPVPSNPAANPLGAVNPMYMAPVKRI
jgi:hypothetical protein